MSADHAHHLAQHARQRHERTLQRASETLTTLVEAGEPVSIAALASRASDESLRRRLALAHQRITQLRNDNQQLREALARAHGQLRPAGTR